MSGLHSRDVIHQDIKLENLIVMPSGWVKLTDFGLAEVLKPNQKVHSKKGTFRYWTPKVILGQMHNHKADIWSIGVCLFAALAGAFPFDGQLEYDYTMDVV
jgi:serine/threonine protein kinase